MVMRTMIGRCRWRVGDVTVACCDCARSEMARLQEDVRRLRFWRGIIAELLGSLFVVFIGCAAFTVTYDEHSLAVKVSLHAARRQGRIQGGCPGCPRSAPTRLSHRAGIYTHSSSHITLKFNRNWWPLWLFLCRPASFHQMSSRLLPPRVVLNLSSKIF